MKTHKRHWLSPQVLVIALLCMSASFGVGVKTTGDVQTVDHLQAEETARVTGDMNGDGKVDLLDVIEILEIARGYKAETAEHRRVEPNGDGAVTVDDAIKLLHDLSSHTL